jgi:hypothetical protein
MKQWAKVRTARTREYIFMSFAVYSIININIALIEIFNIIFNLQPGHSDPISDPSSKL